MMYSLYNFFMMISMNDLSTINPTDWISDIFIDRSIVIILDHSKKHTRVRASKEGETVQTPPPPPPTSPLNYIARQLGKYHLKKEILFFSSYSTALSLFFMKQKKIILLH
jgi:hypothetical protein